jgi:hypothetical protein
MTTNEKPYEAIEGNHHAAFVAEAMMLRALHSYRTARQQAKFYVHSDMEDYFKPPSYDKLRLKYEDLMHECQQSSRKARMEWWPTSISSPRSSPAG